MFKLIFSIIIYIILIVQSSKLQKYDVKRDSSVQKTLDPFWLIRSFKINNKVSCLVECNLEDQCFSTIFSEKLSDKNCFLYRKYLNTTEITSSNGFFLYTKTCKRW
jgi:hypothetical protein